jgi:hypothetical protein
MRVGGTGMVLFHRGCGFNREDLEFSERYEEHFP